MSWQVLNHTRKETPVEQMGMAAKELVRLDQSTGGNLVLGEIETALGLVIPSVTADTGLTSEPQVYRMSYHFG